MSLFTEPINDITYEDVVSFCEQGIGEGVNLDYKKDFPQELERTISAFANTFGGLIIIGVEEEDSKPKPPFVGIKYKERLEERVWNIILDNIYPPLFPEIRVCPPNSDHTFVIIRIPESNETPHAIYNNTDVYIRTGNRNKPDEKASEEKREWLRYRRKKSENLRELLQAQATERYRNVCKAKKAESKCGEFTLAFCPLYPQRPLMGLEQIETTFDAIRVEDTAHLQFPKILERGTLLPIQDGMYYFVKQEDTNFFSYAELNKFGLLFYRDDSGWINKEEETKSIYSSHILGVLSLAFQSAFSLYRRLGCWGNIEFRFSLSKLLGTRFIPLLKNMFGEWKKPSEVEETLTDDVLSWTVVLSVNQLEDQSFRNNKLVEMGQDLHWSFGCKIGKNIIQDFIEKRSQKS
jgi:hypothetical protein